MSNENNENDVQRYTFKLDCYGRIAFAAKLKVQAGLTPRERAEIEMKTRIGIAAELAKTKFPQQLIIGGGNGSPTNPFDAVGLEAFIRINEKISKTKTK